jgi:predicted ATPase/DNA-binding winged helix-turn-helix (wHTH) protein
MKRSFTISFGSFQLFASGRRLLRDKVPVDVGSRSLDILIALVERVGEVVCKKELVARVWPDVVVDETSLRTHVARLRRALGDGRQGARYIANVPGRGYCFVAPITRTAALLPAQAADSIPTVPPLRLPSRLARMIGRDDAVAGLCVQLLNQRFVSIVGPGGIGKTTVAVSVAHALVREFSGAVAFVDLASIEDPRLVAGAVASTLGLAVHMNDPIPNLIAFLDQKRILLVLDSCEHVIESAAALTEQLYIAAPETYILTTSRELLRVEGEHVHKLAPLAVPDEKSDLSAAEALGFPAVQLFMERAAAGGNHIDLTDAEAHLVAGICRKLDGIALALELAAGRVAAYGIRGTAELLELRFKLLWQGRRTALPRHQTLNAMLDWSYNLLSEDEQRVLSRLSVFVGVFTLEAAQFVAAEADTSAEQVAEMLATLVAKSLVATPARGASVRYWLLDTTRAYASVKMAESGETDMIARRHAEHFVRFVANDNRAGVFTDPSTSPTNAEQLGNIRAALEWCFSQRGDHVIGCNLAVEVLPLLLRLSLLTECRNLSEWAIAILPDTDKETVHELTLLESQAISAMFTLGNDGSVRAAIQRGLDLASVLRDHPRQLQLLAGLNIFLTRIGDFQSALHVAEKSAELARTMADPAAAMMADWMLGVVHHLMGDQRAALVHCESGFAPEAALQRMNRQYFSYDHRIRALVALARTLWLQGFADRAASVAWQAIDESAELDQPVNLCISRIYTTTVFLWRGDWQAAEEGITKLIAEAKKHSLGPYYAVGLGLQGELMLYLGDRSGGMALLRRSLNILATEQHLILAPQFGMALAQGLMDTGQFDQALAAVERAIAQRDHLTLRETLAVDTALIEDGRRIPNEAIHAWSESLFSDANFAVYPTYATETGLTTTLIVLRRGTEHRAKLALASQQRWRFGISEDRIVTLTIMPEPLPALPTPVAAYIEATNACDLPALLATFADDALVNDRLQDYWGKVAIAEWAARDIIGARLTMYVVDVLEHHGHVVVTAHVDGGYEKRGLPCPLVLTFHFAPRGDQIVQLIILRNQAGI